MKLKKIYFKQKSENEIKKENKKNEKINGKRCKHIRGEVLEIVYENKGNL